MSNLSTERPLSAAELISVDAEIMHGEPCFVGTRVPVSYLFDHLRAGA
jgi:uncharacterized protein (DUF433 family)